MNEAEIHALFKAVPEHYLERVPADQMRHIRADASVGEWGLLLQELLLHLREATVTPTEHDQLSAMVTYVESEDETVTIDQPLAEVLEEIPVCES